MTNTNYETLEKELTFTESEELSETELENAAGGILVSTAITTVGLFALGGAELSFFLGYGKKKLGKLFKK